jgi:methyl-accepting chemotaxis protein
MLNLRNLSVGKKLALLVAIQLIGIGVILGQSIVYNRATLLEERKLAVRNVVESSWGILDYHAKLAAAGKLSVAEAQQQAAAAIAAQRYAGNEYLFIIDRQPAMVMHPFKPELNGKDMSDYKDPDGTRLFIAMRDVVNRDGAGYVFYRWPRPGAAQPVPKVSYVKGFETWGWIVGSGVYTDDVAAAALAGATRLLVLLLITAAVIAAMAIVISRAVTRPLRQAVAVLQDLAEGEGDLTKRLPVAGRDEIGELAMRFNKFMDKLHDTIINLRPIALNTVTAARELSGAAQALSSGAQEQASSLEETAASLEEITGTVKQTADNARQANQFAAGSRDTAEKGGAVVTSAVEAMSEINRASKKIADIITTIDEIAFQTNLLALNAAVEAARAGEQGRGFAVVAAEVRNLAQRSATAAKEIKALIQDSVQKVEAGSELVNRSGETLGEIVTSVKRVTDIIGEIAAASQEQTTGIDQVNRAVTQMDQVVQSNAAQTEELSSTAHALAGQAEQLQELVGRFKLDAAAAITLHQQDAAPPTSKAIASVPGRIPERRASSPHPRQSRKTDVPVLAAAPATNGKTHHPDDGFEEF